MTHPNIESMRRYSETLTAGKAADVLPYFSGDLALHIPGHAASHVRWARRSERTSAQIDRVVIYRIEDAKIAEVWVRDWDQYAYDEMFSDAEPEASTA